MDVTQTGPGTVEHVLSPNKDALATESGTT